MAGKYAFISYARQNRDYVDRLVEHLGGIGLPCWHDVDLEIGDAWLRKLEQKVTGCSAFIVVASEASAASPWVERELALAERLEKPILPLQLGFGHWWRLSNYQVLEVGDGRMPGPRFVERLKVLLTSSSKTPAVARTLPPEIEVIAARLQVGDLEGADQTSAMLLTSLAGEPPIVTSAALDRLPDTLLRLLCWLYRSSGGVEFRDRPFVVNDAFGSEASGLSARSIATGRTLLRDRLDAVTGC